CQTYITSPFTF
nr:immunoglobulin light chain junction region [Macaca mulatta]MOV76839.1 immunoglobulin light chain junction region [Macaca mulatta]MOV76918.1 immunoglobulin light chain junction region [Macaca mulatta]